MSRLYDALKNAQTNLPKFEPTPVLRSAPQPEDTPILRLLQAIDARLSGRPRRVVQVMACHADHRSDVARRIARVGATTMQRSVMLVDSIVPPLPAHSQPAPPPAADLPAIPPCDTAEAAARPADDLPYTVASLVEQTVDGSVEPHRLRAAWDRLRMEYELVVIDSPAVDQPLGLAIAPTVDGVLLLIAAEKTRLWQAETARDALIGGGANLLGAVLDERRFWGPKILRRLL